MREGKHMTDDEREVRIRDAIKRGDIEGNAVRVWFGIVRAWRAGKSLSDKQRWWLRRLTRMAVERPAPLLDDDHG